MQQQGNNQISNDQKGHLNTIVGRFIDEEKIFESNSIVKSKSNFDKVTRKESFYINIVYRNRGVIYAYSFILFRGNLNIRHINETNKRIQTVKYCSKYTFKGYKRNQQMGILWL